VRRAARLPLEQLQPWLLELPTDPAPLDLARLFGNDHPVELEVGFGKGLFLLTASQAHPEINYLGIEIERKYALYTATRLAKRRLGNVRVACADARTTLPGFLADGCLQAVHVYFPDPWWKNRHRKRRLFTDEFARQCQRVLQPGGQFHVVSDVQEYFEIITKLVDELPQLERLPPPDVKDPEHEFDYLTNFDRKYRQEGRPIYRARWRKSEAGVAERPG
jgi:tRNA (guanine-N7-)-methyltransferase